MVSKASATELPATSTPWLPIIRVDLLPSSPASRWPSSMLVAMPS